MVTDAELLAAVRAGSTQAYGVLYLRHFRAARRVADQLSYSPSESEDLVAEAFAKVLDSIRTGNGPHSAFRSYLLRTMRNALVDKVRRDGRIFYSDDLSVIDPGVPFVDTTVESLEAELVSRALASLPARWQSVLWHTEVEGESMATVASRLDMTTNGVAALAYRAREGLRKAYLQLHVPDGNTSGSEHVAADLGAWVRHGLSRRREAAVDAHLAVCAPCQRAAREVADVNSRIRAMLPVHR